MTSNILKQMYIEKEKESHNNRINGNNNHKSMGITHKHMKQNRLHDQQQQNHHQEPVSNQYTVNLHFDSIVPDAGRNTVLTISVAEKSGTPVREFELVHDKLMHLIIVGEDLSYFAHIHPTLIGADGNFTIDHIFPESGIYKLWVDFKPKGGKQTLVTFLADVKGLPTHNLRIPVYDGVYIKESSNRDYRISLKLSQEKTLAKRETDMIFSISMLQVIP